MGFEKVQRFAQTSCAHRRKQADKAVPVLSGQRGPIGRVDRKLAMRQYLSARGER